MKYIKELKMEMRSEAARSFWLERNHKAENNIVLQSWEAASFMALRQCARRIDHAMWMDQHAKTKVER